MITYVWENKTDARIVAQLQDSGVLPNSSMIKALKGYMAKAKKLAGGRRSIDIGIPIVTKGKVVDDLQQGISRCVRGALARLLSPLD